MSPSHVLEPTYDGLRRRLLAGFWPAGQRLEANRLADELGVSMTPVRDSLNRLVGERLIQASPGEGFHVPRLDETELRGLLRWHRALVELALNWPGTILVSIVLPKGHDGIAERTALLFAAITAVAGNGELDEAITNAAGRLGAYRRIEESVLDDAAAELGGMEQAARSNDRAALAQLVQRYHSRRHAAADRLVHVTRTG